ncbi:MAG: M3 family oligoendopeptidase [Firmicutes bacterium]|nr:M3 family oligoendopeptidase [Bacillota bacterium]
MKFSEIAYKRPDTDSIMKQYDSFSEQISSATKASTIFNIVSEHEKISSEYETMNAIAYIRHTLNTNDNFYTKEKAFYDEVEPLLQEKKHTFMLALNSSPFRADLENRYGKLIFKNIDLSLKTFSPEIIPDLQEENRLTSEYQKLIASAQIPFNGQTLTISQLAAYKQDPDRNVRMCAYTAEGNFYMSHAGKLDDIFDKLVKCRTNMAKKLGFSSYTELAYLIRLRNCYNSEMVKIFREQIVNEIVPIVVSLKKKQSERIGIPDMKLYDDPFSFKEGNPHPVGTADDILAAGKRMYSEMSPETKEFIELMYDKELLDVISRKGKAVGGYCIEIPSFGYPFIFSNFNGTSGDVEVLTHEAGHAYAAYRANSIELLENRSPTMESCETHSMSMEFMAWRWLDLFYGNDTDRAKYMHLEKSLVFLPYGCMVDHFQHIVYDNPDLTPSQRHEEWKKLEKIYRPYIDAEGIPFYGEGRTWQRQLHIYQHPFYYIDYCLAQTVALNFWALTQKDFDDAWKRYNAFVCEGGKLTFTELCEVAGVASPFVPGSIKATAETARTWLESNAK